MAAADSVEITIKVKDSQGHVNEAKFPIKVTATPAPSEDPAINGADFTPAAGGEGKAYAAGATFAAPLAVGDALKFTTENFAEGATITFKVTYGATGTETEADGVTNDT